VYRDHVGNAGGSRHRTQKKTCHAAEQEREDVAAARRVSQIELSIDRLVFIDESWATTNRTRRHGRTLKGKRLVAAVPHGHWRTTTLIGALRFSGLSTPAVIDGAVNGEIFLAYVREVLAPTLRPGDIVVMDNLSSHKIAGIREAMEAIGAELRYLLPCSPDLNPIEQVFAKLNALLRKIAARSVEAEALWTAIGQLLTEFQPDECVNYFRNSGYVRSA
jgi:transposase